MGAEAALVRLQLFSGTHAISSALFGCLRPNDTMLCVSGKPYDTLEEVIGKRINSQTGALTGSLLDWGIKYEEIELLYNKEAAALNGRNVAFDLDLIDSMLEKDPSIKLIHVQRFVYIHVAWLLHIFNNGHNYDRSCGYQWRPSIPIVEIERLCTHINTKYKHSDKKRDVIVFVDNCYGELVEDQEPGHVGKITLCVYIILSLSSYLLYYC